MPLLDPADRDAALLRLRRARVWIAVGAAALTALATAAAATSFRGHQASAAENRGAARVRPAPSGPDAIPLPGSASADDGLRPPEQPPQPAPADTPPATTSGGS